MGTRADFYIKKEEKMVWLASVAWDGYPSGIDESVIKASTETEFKESLTKYLSPRSDVSTPETGWPWPWDDSKTSDYAYMFDGSQVLGSCFGSNWFPAPLALDDEKELEEIQLADAPEFPNMKDKANVQYSGDRSGLIVVSATR